jgi:hypothetical protein
MQALLDLQTIPDDAAIAIYCEAFDASYANGIFDPILFERSFSDSVSSYLSGNSPQSLMTIQDAPMSSAVLKLVCIAMNRSGHFFKL